MVGFTTDPQHLFALVLQLSGQSVDGLVQGVDLMVQIGDAVAAGAHVCLQVGDTSQELLFLDEIRERCRHGQKKTKKLVGGR